MSQTSHCVKKLYYLFNCKSEISNVYNEVEGHCLQAMKIVHHYANSCFEWLISGHQSVNPSREAISILSGKHKRFTFVHPVLCTLYPPPPTPPPPPPACLVLKLQDQLQLGCLMTMIPLGYEFIWGGGADFIVYNLQQRTLLSFGNARWQFARNMWNLVNKS